MSENLDLVRSIYADWERGDFSHPEWADPDIEWVLVEGPSPGTWHGLAGMAEGFRGWFSASKDVHVYADEFREIDDERVVVLVDATGRGKASGLEYSPEMTRTAHLFHVRGGKVVRFLFYLDRDRAFADLGLKEYAVSQENVERVQRLYEYLNQGDIDAALALLDPGVEWWTREDTPATEIAKGRKRWRARWAEITDVFEEFHQEPTEVIDAGEYVVVCVDQVARTRGVLIDQHEVHVFRLRDGLVIELREFHEKRHALEAVWEEG